MAAAGLRSPPFLLFQLYLFDVDGTLVDSADDICGAIQTVLSTTRRPDVEQAFLKQYIGYHLIDLFRDLFPEKSTGRGGPAGHRVSRRLSGAWSQDDENVSARDRDDRCIAGSEIHRHHQGHSDDAAILERFGLLPYFDSRAGYRRIPLQARAGRHLQIARSF